jgi:hypothetical protein
VCAERITVITKFPSTAAFTEHLRDMSAPLIALLTRQPAEAQATFWQRLMAALQPYVTTEGTVHMANNTICVAGQRVD